ncbi:cysteine dioxygenase [Brevibacillus dissolubilis]|uniref:cysteine dioxygenase n=1 Tax=Brevibacillus dissolubilis TaxID=1844116 RepID=UPI0011179A85|nr:cysteine dioxygenase family protein [Brevibacillus dissolubilis]
MELMESIQREFGSLKKPTVKDLWKRLISLPNLSESVLPHLREPDQYAYGRNVIYRTEELEVIVMNFPARQRTAIHDHGLSIGCGIVVEGKLINTLYSVIQEGQVQPKGEQRVSRGQCFFAPPGLIHGMENRTEERLVTLHVYSPPLDNMKVYQQAKEANSLL